MNLEIIEYIELKSNEKSLLSIFSTSKPRDLIIGTYSGLKNVSIGVIGGISSLVIFPLYGTINEGCSGFIRGVGAGLLTGFGLPITGIFLGGLQFCKGIINTPKAFYYYYNGKIWDDEKKKWILYNLNQETLDFLKKKEIDFFEKKNLYEYNYIKNTSDNKEFYRILQLDINCSQKEIKESYRKLALKFHPDRNNNNTEMKNIFLKINEAYNILNNPETRRLYNLNGKKGLNKIIDIKTFMNLFFETDKIYFFIGELKVIDYMNKNYNLSSDINQYQTKKREITLSNNLCEFLKIFSDKVIDIEEYYTQKTNDLMINVFGCYIIKIIGNIYIEIAQNYLSFFRTIINTVKYNARNIENNISFVSSIIKSNYTLSNKKKITSSMIDIILSMIIFDLEDLISNICYKILNDFSVSYNQRIDRANGLIYIGEIFVNNSSTYEEARNFFKNKLISLN